jgi:hypothetical protein
MVAMGLVLLLEGPWSCQLVLAHLVALVVQLL